MFFGESVHSLDPKGRAFVPKRFQVELQRAGSTPTRCVVTPGTEGCLFLFGVDGFEEAVMRMQREAFHDPRLRDSQRVFFSQVHEGQLDSSGRILLPERLRLHAGLEKEVAMVGAGDRAEIWRAEAWAAFQQENAQRFDELAGRLVAPAAPPAPPTSKEGGAPGP